MSRVNDAAERAAGLRATRAYAELLFAFGFARLGEAGEVGRLRESAPRCLRAEPRFSVIQSHLLGAFRYRIDEATRGEPHTGGISGEVGTDIERYLLHPGDHKLTPDPGPYFLAQFLALSRVLEPERVCNPYYGWMAHSPRQPDGREQYPLWGSLPKDREITESSFTAFRGRCSDTRIVEEVVVAFLRGARKRPFEEIGVLLRELFDRIPPVPNTFTTCGVYSRLHLGVTDAVVLMVVGTGPLPPSAERPARLELLKQLHPRVLSWIEAVPAR